MGSNFVYSKSYNNVWWKFLFIIKTKDGNQVKLKSLRWYIVAGLNTVAKTIELYLYINNQA